MRSWLRASCVALVTVACGQGTSPTIDASSTDASGIDAAGIDAAGIDAAGIDAAGIDAAGIDAAGIDAAGIDAAGPVVYTITVAPVHIAGNEVYVADVTAGTTVTVVATGSINFDTNASASCTSLLTYTVGPDGLSRSVYDDPVNSLCYDDLCTDPLPTAAHAGLYGQLGAATQFVGSSVSFVAPVSGAARLGVNDCSGSDNGGVGFSVQVTLEP